jgi:uncharacterized Zn finger protein
MCKHVAAVLYGVGARLDQQPALLFGLRRVDEKDLLAQADASGPRAGRSPTRDRVLDESALGDVFGIELAQAPPKVQAKARRQPAASIRRLRGAPVGVAAKARAKRGSKS